MVAAVPFWQTTGENDVAKKEHCTQPLNCTPYGHLLLLFTTISNEGKPIENCNGVYQT